METPATTAATPPAPPSESKQQQAPPPPPPSVASSDAPPKKRKLEEVGFHYSPYYKIRATVANLRGRFLQVCQATEDQKTDAAPEILKEIKSVLELSKKTRIDLNSVVEPVKLSVKPAAATSKYEPAGKTPSAENQIPPISLAGNFVQNTGGNILHKPDNSVAAGQSRLVSPVEIRKEARPCEITEVTKQPGEVLKGSYVIGGSPIGWNFLMWPGTKAAYYGLTKTEWLARQSAK